MGDGLTQGIHDTTLYVEKKYFRNFTEPNVKFVLSLHYNGNDSYLFVKGRQELKFKCKTDQLVKEKLCIGNLSDQWTASESEKTRTKFSADTNALDDKIDGAEKKKNRYKWISY